MSLRIGKAMIQKGMSPVRMFLAPRRSLELGIGLALAAGALAVATIWGGPRSTRPPGGAHAFEVTRLEAVAPAPEWDLIDLDGRRVRLQDFRGRVVFLNFWATWCVPCRDEMPAMETLSRELGPHGLAVLAVNYKEPPALVSGFARELALALPLLLDPEGNVAAQYRLVGLPATYFIDRRGALVGSVLGIRNWSAPEARVYLGQLLAAPS